MRILNLILIRATCAAKMNGNYRWTDRHTDRQTDSSKANILPYSKGGINITGIRVASSSTVIFIHIYIVVKHGYNKHTYNELTLTAKCCLFHVIYYMLLTDVTNYNEVKSPVSDTWL